MDCSLPRLLHPWDFPGKSTGVGCYCLLHTIPSTEFKSSFFFCCLILISGLKEKVMCLRHIKTLKSHFMCLRPRDVEGKKVFVLSSSLRIPDPYLLFKSPRSPFSSSGIPDFLSTCLRTVSYRRRQSIQRKKKLTSIMNYPEAFLSKLIHTHFP